MLSGYQSFISEVKTSELIQLGFLTDVEVYTSKTMPNLASVEVVNGDYNQTQASKILREEIVLKNAVEEYLRIAGWKKKTIVFATDIKHCEVLYNVFLNIGMKVGRVHSNMKESEVEKAFEDFKNNDIQLLINVDIATFGFDEPSIECMLFVRPIKSLRLYIQMVGRGIRTFKGKTKCLLIDCANVLKDNGYPTDDIVFKSKPIINKRLDKILKLEREVDGSIDVNKVTKERVEYLTKIGSLIDLYADKVYEKEQDLLDDCRTILKRGGFDIWRQNSGKAFMDGRWVQFTDRNGLPDITMIYKSVYIGLELKLPKGKLTPNQTITLNDFTENKVIFFIIENVIDLFECLEIIQNNISFNDKSLIINNYIYNMNETQRYYRQKYKLRGYL